MGGRGRVGMEPRHDLRLLEHVGDLVGALLGTLLADVGETLLQCRVLQSDRGFRVKGSGLGLGFRFGLGSDALQRHMGSS